MNILYAISFLCCIGLWSCSDQLLPIPPEQMESDKETGAIAYSEVNGMDQWMSRSRIFSIHPDGSHNQLLAQGMVALAASQGRLLTLSGYTSIHLLTTDRGTIALRTVAETESIDPYTLAFSPAGNRIAYTTAIGESSRTTTLVNSDGSNPVQLPIAVADSSVPAFSPDSRQLAFVGVAELAMDRQLYIVNSDGTGLRLLTDLPLITNSTISTIDWAPNGKKVIATSALNPDTHAMFLVDTDSGKWQQIGWGFAPRWSPNGMEIAYTATANQTSDRDIHIVNVNDLQAPRAVTESASGQASSNLRIQWSPDGRKLLYVHIPGPVSQHATTPGTLMLLDLGSSRDVAVADNVFRGFWVR